MRLELPRLEEMGRMWTPAVPADWSTERRVFGRLLQPVLQSIQVRHASFFEQAAAALQVLRLPGHRDGVQPAQLRSYFYAPPKELAVNSKKKGAAGRARWAGRALIRVADLLWRHGVELRKVMKGAFDELPSAAEEMERLAERVAKLEKQLEVEKVKKEQAQAAHRQSSGRLKLKNKAATDARKHEHKKMLGFNKAQRKKVIAKYKATRKAILAEVQKKVEADAAKKVEAETLKLKKRVKAARKRARDVESTAKNSAKYLRRAKLAEGALQKLQSTLEEEESEDEDESGAETSEESDEEEGSSEKPARAQARSETRAGAFKRCPTRRAS